MMRKLAGLEEHRHPERTEEHIKAHGLREPRATAAGTQTALIDPPELELQKVPGAGLTSQNFSLRTVGRCGKRVQTGDL